MATSTYVYQPLNHPDDIRLLTLLPEKAEDDVTIQVEHIALTHREVVKPVRLSLSEVQQTLPEGWKVHETLEGRYVFRHDETSVSTWTHPLSIDSKSYDSEEQGDNDGLFQLYEALSYTWGASGEEEPIFVKNEGLSYDTTWLRPNLATCFPRHLRELEPRKLWIDAISIDQANINKRSSQVRRMGKIYQSAKRVVVWLGPAHENSDTAMDVLEHLGRQTVCCRGWYFNAPEATKPELHLPQVDLPYSDKVWQAIQALLSRS